MRKDPLHIGYICLFVAALTLSSAFAVVGFFLGIIVTVIVTIAWGFFFWRKWIMGSILCMLMLVLGISLGVILGGSRLVLLVSLLGTLSSWDLAAFHKRLSACKDNIDEDQMIRTHLLRLTSVLIISLTLPLVAFGLQFNLQFWHVFLLGILLLVGLSQVFAQLKRSNID